MKSLYTIRGLEPTNVSDGDGHHGDRGYAEQSAHHLSEESL